MNHFKQTKKRNLSSIVLLTVLVVSMFFLSACGNKKAPVVELSDLTNFPVADMSGYAGLKNYNQSVKFVDVTVKDVDTFLKEGKSFVLLTSFAECPWCNAIIPYLCDAASEAQATIALIDTRKDPSWKNNFDLLDYDLFAEDFGEYLATDEGDRPHLYVPHVFFIKDGKVVYQHQGALAEMGDNPHMELTNKQKEELRDIYRDGFRAIE